MKKTILSFAIAAILAAQPHAHAVLGVGDIVSDPIAEEALLHKNIFDQLNRFFVADREKAHRRHHELQGAPTSFTPHTLS